MGRNCYGPKLTWADFVMGRNDPEPRHPNKTENMWTGALSYQHKGKRYQHKQKDLTWSDFNLFFGHLWLSICYGNSIVYCLAHQSSFVCFCFPWWFYDQMYRYISSQLGSWPPKSLKNCQKNVFPLDLPEMGVMGTLSSLNPIFPYSFFTSIHKSKECAKTKTEAKTQILTPCVASLNRTSAIFPKNPRQTFKKKWITLRIHEWINLLCVIHSLSKLFNHLSIRLSIFHVNNWHFFTRHGDDRFYCQFTKQCVFGNWPLLTPPAVSDMKHNATSLQ